ncbi:hypothetical protein [Hymenobacter lucidus]|nr:hypothetical protein [Hymenobacter lucidus]
MPPSKLEHFRPWQTVLLTGNVWQDYFSLQQAQTILRQLHHAPNHDRGLRIRFGPQASYASLIQTLDQLYNADVNKYWLDIHHEPTTLYTFTTYQQQPLIECYGTFTGKQATATLAPRLYSCTEVGTIPFKLMPPEEASIWAHVTEDIPPFSITTTWASLLLLALVSGGRLFRQWQQA